MIFSLKVGLINVSLGKEFLARISCASVSSSYLDLGSKFDLIFFGRLDFEVFELASRQNIFLGPLFFPKVS